MINIVLVLIGFIIRLVAIKTLGDNFSTGQALSGNITRNGIYKFVRHPCYLGSIIIFGGLCWGQYIGFAIFLLAVLFFYDRADREEVIMVAQFGQVYEEYKSTTGMFLPLLRG